jgi:uncharacterized protein YecE (DUF72 family)
MSDAAYLPPGLPVPVPERNGLSAPFWEGLREGKIKVQRNPRTGVFQFPPQGRAIVRDPAAFARSLGRFLGGLPTGPVYAVEFRDRELLGPDSMRALSDSGARLCLGVHARMPPVEIQAAAATSLGAGPLVIRWNLHSGFAYDEAKSRYAPFNRLVDEDPETRTAIANLCREALAAGHEAMVIANNKAEGSAPLTLARLAEAIAG